MAEQTPVVPAPKPGIDAVKVSPASILGAAPAPKVEAPAPVVAPVVETKVDDLAPRFAELDKAHARISKERLNLANEKRALKAKEEELAEYQKLREDRRRNPDKYLKADFGDDYYDKLTRWKTEGTPPADMIASEVDERVAKLQKKMDEQSAALEKRFADAQAQENARAKNEYLSNAVEHAKSLPDKYKGIHHFKEFNAIPAEIERHFRATCKQDAEGNWQPGETLTFDKAAEAVEANIKKLADVFRGYFEAEAKAKGATPTTQTPTQRRETETAQPEGWMPPKNDAERLRRAFAAGDAHLASRQTH